jgi:hypothetical protein
VKNVTILDRSELRRLPVDQLEKNLQSVENEKRYAIAILNGSTTMSDGDIERLYRRIKTLDVYEKNIKNEIETRDDAHES